MFALLYVITISEQPPGNPPFRLEAHATRNGVWRLEMGGPGADPRVSLWQKYALCESNDF